MSYLQQGPTDCWPWSGHHDEAPNKNSKMACRNPLCCNPRHFVSKGDESIEMEPDETVPDLGVNSPEPKPRRGRPPKVK